MKLTYYCWNHAIWLMKHHCWWSVAYIISYWAIDQSTIMYSKFYFLGQLASIGSCTPNQYTGQLASTWPCSPYQKIILYWRARIGTYVLWQAIKRSPIQCQTRETTDPSTTLKDLTTQPRHPKSVVQPQLPYKGSGCVYDSSTKWVTWGWQEITTRFNTN